MDTKDLLFSSRRGVIVWLYDDIFENMISVTYFFPDDAKTKDFTYASQDH